jgi:GMP reductase
MRIEEEIKLDFQDVLIRPKRSTLKSRSEVSLLRSFVERHTGAKTRDVVPIVASNMDTTGVISVAETLTTHRALTALHKFHTVDELSQISDEVAQHCFVSMGITEKDMNFLKEIVSRHEIFSRFYGLCVDVANGYQENFVSAVAKIREIAGQTFPYILAGNVVTADMTEALILAGASAVKVGIGPGFACTTRLVAGVGYPQLSAVIECADAAHGLGAQICSDGGCRTSGDVAIAFGGGADFVMLGGMLAGHEQSGGDLVEKDGQKYKRFYGMSSDVALEKYYSDKQAGNRYRASEGREVLIPYRGDLNNTFAEILGGVRSACTYVGASRLKELSKRTTFVRINRKVSH